MPWRPGMPPSPPRRSSPAPARRPGQPAPSGPLGALVEGLATAGVQMLAKKAVVDGLDLVLSTPAMLDAVAKGMFVEEGEGGNWEEAAEPAKRRWRARARAATSSLQRVFRAGKV
jgi:hypothetical protein